MPETKEDNPVPAQDAGLEKKIEDSSNQEVDESEDKFETVGPKQHKNHQVEKIKKNYSKPVKINLRGRVKVYALEYSKTNRILVPKRPPADSRTRWNSSPRNDGLPTRRIGISLFGRHSQAPSFQRHSQSRRRRFETVRGN